MSQKTEAYPRSEVRRCLRAAAIRSVFYGQSVKRFRVEFVKRIGKTVLVSASSIGYNLQDNSKGE
jgi:hypothetical protein